MAVGAGEIARLKPGADDGLAQAATPASPWRDRLSRLFLENCLPILLDPLGTPGLPPSGGARLGRLRWRALGRPTARSTWQSRRLPIAGAQRPPVVALRVSTAQGAGRTPRCDLGQRAGVDDHEIVAARQPPQPDRQPLRCQRRARIHPPAARRSRVMTCPNDADPCASSAIPRGHRRDHRQVGRGGAVDQHPALPANRRAGAIAESVVPTLRCVPLTAVRRPAVPAPASSCASSAAASTAPDSSTASAAAPAWGHL